MLTVNRCAVLSNAISAKVRELGLAGMLFHLASKLVQEFKAAVCGTAYDAFDSKYGTDTARSVGVWALDLPLNRLGQASRYETVAGEVFWASLKEIRICYNDFVFIDLGSGKGRALLMASRLPFKAIIGVELSSFLNTIANRNIDVFRDDAQKCLNISSICQDALDYEFPKENLVVYLYNPFNEKIMQSVVEKAESFVKKTGCKVFIVYHNPVFKKLWSESGVFEKIYSSNQCALYSSKNLENRHV